jgi:pyruvate dehydrogenase kinase 2/3/4
MRDEWKTSTKNSAAADSRSSQGLTHVGGHQIESSKAGDLDRSASVTLRAKGMRLKGGMGDLRSREVSARRQVGDAESMITTSMDEKGDGRAPWWRNVGMEEGL